MTSSDQRERYYERLRPQALAPLWTVLKNVVPAEPRAAAHPYGWKWAEVFPQLLESASLISAEEAERRVLMLANPGIIGRAQITDTLYAGLQLLLPGERAPLHRHTQSAFRLVLHGSGAYTSVNGEMLHMSRGDLVITPHWTWHHHGHEGSEPVVWLDGLDVPLVSFLNAGFREEGKREIYTIDNEEGVARTLFDAGLAPTRGKHPPAASPVLSYSYERARQALHAMAKTRTPDPHLGHCIRYVNPSTGDWAMPTLGTTLRGFPNGFCSRPYRSTDSLVLVVLQGQLTITIDAGARITLAQNDIASVPGWCGWSVTADEDSTCFGFSDRPVHEKLGLLRERRD